MNQVRHLSNFKRIALGVIVFLTTVLEPQAQSFENLNHLEGTHTTTYYSNGSKTQAENMAMRCDSVIAFYKTILNFEPTVNLLVLSPADWNIYTNFPVYGMPHYNDSQTLIVASEDNDFWKSFIPPLDQLSTALTQQISSTYTDSNNNLSMRSFFDLLAIHELGHAYHGQGELKMQRLWMGELFANILLHTYIARKEPDLLPSLTVFPQMVVSSTNPDGLAYKSLSDLESNYAVIGQQYPNNYGWYQSKWHIAAGTIYDQGGVIALQNLWKTLQKEKTPLDDAAFANLLSTKVHQSVADVQLKWME